MNTDYLKEKDNVITDVLSRVSSLPFTNQNDDQNDIIPVHMIATEIPIDSTSVAELRKATVQDTTLGLLTQAVVNGWPKSKRIGIPFY